MKIRIEEDVLEGTGTEIMDRLRSRMFDAAEFPDTESYIWFLRINFMRMTGLDCALPEGGTEAQARAMLAKLEGIGALEMLEAE